MHDTEPDNVHQGNSRPAPVTQAYQQYSSQRTSQSPPSSDDRRPEAERDYSDSDSTDLKENARDSGSGSDFDFDDVDEMAARPALHRPTGGRSHEPLLKYEQRGRQFGHTVEDEEDGGGGDERARTSSHRGSTFRSRTPDYDAKHATRRKYIYATGFLLICLVSFTVQTETAVYVQHNLGWEKPYCML